MESFRDIKPKRLKPKRLFKFLVILLIFCSFSFIFSGNLHFFNDTTMADYASNEIDTSNNDDIQAMNSESNLKQDSGHMIYFAVYFLDEMCPANRNWQVIKKFAPQNSTEGMTLDNSKNDYSTLCHMSYAGKDFYLYDDGVLAHNREYKQVNILLKENVDFPQVDVITAKNGYKYAGFSCHKENTTKFSSSKQLPVSKNEASLDGTETKSNLKSTNFDDLYCITISLYFYLPAKIIAHSDNYDFGRFSANENATFNTSLKMPMTLNYIQLGMNIKTNVYTADNSLKIWIYGTYSYIENGEKHEIYREYNIYVKTNVGCYVSRLLYSGENQILFATIYSFNYSFTMQTHSATINLQTNLSNPQDFEVYCCFGIFRKKVELKSGRNSVSVMIENIPANYIGSLYVEVKKLNTESSFLISSKEIDEINGDINNQQLFISDPMVLENDLNEISCYFYEIFSINVEPRTNEKLDMTLKFNKIYGIDFKLPFGQSIHTSDGFKFIGYSGARDSLEKIEKIDTNKNTTIFANFSKELVAKVYVGEFASEYVFKEIIYNFDKKTTFKAENLPEDTKNFIGYTNSIEIIDFDNELNKFGIFTDNAKYYAVYEYDFSVKYDLSYLDENTTLVGEEPVNYSSKEYRISGGKYPVRQIEISSTSFNKIHYDFLGWSKYSGGGDEYLHFGDLVTLSIDNQQVTLYPILDEHKYSIKINANGGEINGETGQAELYCRNSEVFRISDIVKKEGYKISNVIVANNPECLKKWSDGYYTYENISLDESFEIIWEIKSYNINLNLISLFPSDESVNLKISYKYNDLQNDLIEKELVFNESSSSQFGKNLFNLVLPFNTPIKFKSEIDRESYNISFNQREDENLEAELDYIVDENNQTIRLYLSRVYKVHLVSNHEEFKAEKIIYKYYGQELSLPRNVFDYKNLEFIDWNDSPNIDGNVLRKIKASVNEEITLYAGWSNFVKFYLESQDKPFLTLTLNIGQTFSESAGLKYYSFKKDDITYYFAGWSKSPSSLTIDYDGSETILEKSVSYYAIWRNTGNSKTVSEKIQVTFYNREPTIKEVTRYITYTNYNVYFSNDFSCFDDSNYLSGRKSYSSEKVDFVKGTYNDYIVYGWSESGNLTDKFFTEDDEIVIGEKTSLYAIYREPISYKTASLKHTFYFATFERPFYKYTNVLTQNSQFLILNYGLNKSKQIDDGKVYEPIYDELEYENLQKYSDNVNRLDYELIGYDTSEYSLAPLWTSGAIKVTEETLWYSVWKHTFNKTEQEVLSHKFFISDDEYIVKNTTKTINYRNIIEIKSCNYEFIKKVSDGEISSISYTNLDYYYPNLNYNYFYGWAVGSESIDVVFSNSNAQSFKPKEETCFYPVIANQISFNVVYDCEGKQSIASSTEVSVISNYSSTVFNINSHNVKVLETEFSKLDGFDGYIENSSQKYYFPNDEIIFKNLKLNNTIYLNAKFSDKELFKVNIIVEENQVEQYYEEGEILVLFEPLEIAGKEFVGYSINGQNYKIGDEIKVYSNLSITAIYSDSGSNNNDDININENKTNHKNSSAIFIAIIILIIIIIAIIVTIIIIVLKNKKSKQSNIKNAKNSKK